MADRGGLDDLPPVLTLAAVARVLGVSVKTVGRLRARGLLPASKTSSARSGRVLVRRRDVAVLLDRLAENQAVTS